MDNDIQITATGAAWLLIRELLQLAVDSNLHLSCDKPALTLKAMAQLSTEIEEAV